MFLIPELIVLATRIGLLAGLGLLQNSKPEEKGLRLFARCLIVIGLGVVGTIGLVYLCSALGLV
ncbi:MAG TPA: hypothetical protein DCY13_13405 [Verrucomicrobiales bacterium]|nr:hypothetical protein [Verrucomicrobiales bacterium]